ncbi:iron-sulfur cluster assembly scaffold protein [Tsuneonella troitsensis]|uniref:iron-sulfur cluster assembly scaffold protein n=1 Tax=Tsuneonella troitsensis TaxID=292222 RepID=UPI00070EFC03|nr:iron-sulfur cluster assembly scaffold protein [Tsuneonella troitsensis]
MTERAADPRGGAVLYTPELLSMAVSLGRIPFDLAMPLSGEARSRTCGSTVRLSCRVNNGGQIEDLGVRVAACAVGQAATALFAKSAIGRNSGEIAVARDEIQSWLVSGETPPDWPGLEALESARAYPARHGAILLAWDAALDALSKAEARG